LPDPNIKENSEIISSNSDSDEENENPSEMPIALTKKKRGPRTSVSAEVYGEWNKKEVFVPKKILKSESANNRIKMLLKKSFMFSELDPKAFQVIVDAMELCDFKENDIIIRQNDPGNCLYIVEEGILSCSKIFVLS